LYGIDIVLENVGGRAAVGIMEAAQVTLEKYLQYIHIGDLAGEDDIVVTSRLLNMKPLRIVGSVMGNWAPEETRGETPTLVAATAMVKRTSDIFTAPLFDVQWY
jgi:hypothetical protein